MPADVAGELKAIAAQRDDLQPLEKAILALLCLLLVVSGYLGMTMQRISSELHDSKIRGLKNRAVACAALGDRSKTIGACQEADVLRFYRAP